VTTCAAVVKSALLNILRIAPKLRQNRFKYSCDNADADFMDRLWLLGINLVFIMVSGENLLERGVRLKGVKPKNKADQPVEYWSPNYLGRVYRAETEGGRSRKSPTATLEKRSA
jgi:hypothetical protein